MRVQNRARLTAFFAALFLLFSCIPFCFADEPALSISDRNLPDPEHIGAAAVYNLENEQEIYAYNPDAVLPVASFAKMMTAVCAYELLADRLDETLTVEYSMIKEASGNQVGYYVGETVCVRDLFGGLLTRGGNDSAYLLCYAAMGSVSDFVARMNEHAAELGMASTVYVNPTGMTAEGAVTTAHDALLIAREFYGIPYLLSISDSITYTMPATNKAAERVLYNRNALVSRIVETGYFDSRVTGINAGSTNEAGYYAANAVCGEDLTYITVVLAAEEADGVNCAYTFTSALATYALEGFGYVEVIKAGGIVCEIPVRLSADADYVTLTPAASLTLYLSSEVDPKTDLTYSYRLESETLTAPVTEGQVVGTYIVSRGGEILGSVDLVTKNSLSKSDFLAVLDQIKAFTTGTFFITAVISAVVLTILYFIIRAILRSAKRRRRRTRRR